MAWTERYANFDLATGDNDGTSEANAWQTPAAVIANVSAGDRVNIKKQSAAYDLTSSLVFNVSGTATSPIYYRAYESSIGDGGLWEVTYNSGGIANLQFTGAYCIVEGVKCTAGASSNLNEFWVAGSNSIAYRCYAAMTSRISISNAYNCFFSVGGTSNARITMAGTNAFNCNLVNCWLERTGSQTTYDYLFIVDMFGVKLTLVNNIFVGLTARNSDEGAVFLDRMADGRGAFFCGNRIYNWCAGISVDEEPNALREELLAVNNIFSTIATYAIERTNAEAGYVQTFGNFYHACTSGFTEYSEESEAIGNTALSASPFVDAGSDDFSINETASAGALVRAAGLPVQHPYDFSSMAAEPVYSGPTAAEIAAAVWTRSGRTLTS